MTDYRVVVMDVDGREVADITSLQVNPSDVLVVMPPSVDCYISAAQVEAIARAFESYKINAIVLPFPVAFARLERIEP